MIQRRATNDQPQQGISRNLTAWPFFNNQDLSLSKQKLEINRTTSQQNQNYNQKIQTKPALSVANIYLINSFFGVILTFCMD